MTRRRVQLTVLGVFIGVVSVASLFAVVRAQARIDFARDVQPIFVSSCYRCHSAQNAMGGLQLDVRSNALRMVVPGKADASRLLARILGAGGEARMPMGGKPLDDRAIGIVRQWINEGAEWPETAVAAKKAPIHWAFVAPARPALPNVRNATWGSNPIDKFVLARLEKEGIAPSPEADKITLLRRLSLDLTGLPPTIEEVDTFVGDRSAKAWEKQVDRLLASPHYGEKWGRQWLDAARYADSDGYEKDKLRQVWFYRDWVINALNKDKPYDQFVIEQVAGDLLPGATQEQRVATGFLRNSMINEEGGVDPEQFRMESMFDRMDAIGKSVLGVTIQCAQCHDHKYEPLKQEEYYRMFAYLNNANEANIAVYTPEDEMKRAEILRRTREIEADLRHRVPDWMDQMAKWEAESAKNLPEWVLLDATVEDISTGGQRYLPLPDKSFLAQGYAPTKHRVKLQATTDLKQITGLRLELLTDPNLPRNGPGRSIKGTCGLTEFEVESARIDTTSPTAKPAQSAKIKIARASADFSQPEAELEPIFDDRSKRRRVVGPIEYAIDGKDETAWGIDAGPGLRNQPRQAVFAFDKPLVARGDTQLSIFLKQNHGGWNSDDNQNNNLGRVRLAVTSSSDPTVDQVPARVRDAMQVSREKRSAAQIDTIFSYWRTTVTAWKSANDQIAKLWEGYPEGSTQLVLGEREQLRKTNVLKRGDFLQPDRVIEGGVPAFLHPMEKSAGNTRLTFAKWLVDRRSPTTARSIVNRIWQSYFGIGLVRTSEDLGKQSEPPSHPELFDWLAVELMDHDWSLKHIHKLLLMSSTYRQSSRVTPELLAKDPENRLLARSSRFRVEAETIRDIELATSGLLNGKVGGPSVFPPSPEFLYMPPVSYGPKVWPVETGSERYRRALYTFRYRSVPYPMLQTFDAPNGDVSCVRRARSNTPLQALVSLNEPVALEAARSLALRTIKQGGTTPKQRVIYAFRSVLARSPVATEEKELLDLLDRQRARFLAGEANPWNLAINDPSKGFPLPKGTSMEELAAWTAVSRVLLNLDETITRE